jgi:chitodextrinase
MLRFVIRMTLIALITLMAVGCDDKKKTTTTPPAEIPDAGYLVVEINIDGGSELYVSTGTELYLDLVGGETLNITKIFVVDDPLKGPGDLLSEYEDPVDAQAYMNGSEVILTPDVNGLTGSTSVQYFDRLEISSRYHGILQFTVVPQSIDYGTLVVRDEKTNTSDLSDAATPLHETNSGYKQYVFVFTPVGWQWVTDLCTFVWNGGSPEVGSTVSPTAGRHQSLEIELTGTSTTEPAGPVIWDTQIGQEGTVIFDITASQTGVSPPLYAGVFITLSVVDGEGPLCPAGETVTTYDWDFGNGNYSADESPLYAYPTDGVYTVVLTVVTDGGTMADNGNTLTITVDPPGSLQVVGYVYTPMNGMIITYRLPDSFIGDCGIDGMSPPEPTEFRVNARENPVTGFTLVNLWGPFYEVGGEKRFDLQFNSWDGTGTYKIWMAPGQGIQTGDPTADPIGPAAHTLTVP